MTDLQTKLVTQDILERSGSQPIYLSTIEVVGGETFSSNFFKKILSPLTENSDYTLSQLLQNVDQSYSRLMKTDVFKKVEISLHSDYVKKLPEVTTYNSEPSIPTKVLFDLSSINLNNGDVFLNLNSDDVLNLDLNYLNNNFFENAEIINLHANYNPYKPNQHLFSDGKLAINLPNPLFKLVGHFYNTNSNNQAWQQLLEHTTGIFSGLQYLSECKNLIALVGLGAAKRTLHDISDVALDDLKFFGGDYMKKSIVAGVKFNKFQYLNKITKNFPTDGVSIELDNEISTNEDVLDKQAAANVSPFAKSTLSAKLFKSFCSNSITTQLAFNLGGIFTNASSPVSIHTSDRFYLGGYDSFRGFTKNSINGEGSGGYQFYKASATIFGKLPSFIYSPNLSAVDGRGINANPLRLYLTGAVGNVSANNDSCIFSRENNDNTSTSAGVGLRYFNNWANFDIGYFVAKRTNSENVAGIKDGFQFSISIGGSNKSI